MKEFWIGCAGIAATGLALALTPPAVMLPAGFLIASATFLFSALWIKADAAAENRGAKTWLSILAATGAPVLAVGLVLSIPSVSARIMASAHIITAARTTPVFKIILLAFFLTPLLYLAGMGATLGYLFRTRGKAAWLPALAAFSAWAAVPVGALLFGIRIAVRQLKMLNAANASYAAANRDNLQQSFCRSMDLYSAYIKEKSDDPTIDEALFVTAEKCGRLKEASGTFDSLMRGLEESAAQGKAAGPEKHYAAFVYAWLDCLTEEDLAKKADTAADVDGLRAHGLEAVRLFAQAGRILDALEADLPRLTESARSQWQQANGDKKVANVRRQMQARSSGLAKLEQAAGLLASSPDWRQAYSDELQAKAEWLRPARDPAAVQALLERSLRTRPDFVDARLLLGEVLVQTAQGTQAAALGQGTIRLLQASASPDRASSAEAWALYGRAAALEWRRLSSARSRKQKTVALKWLAQAESALAQAGALDPSNRTAADLKKDLAP